jgi:hypothetical protein
VDPPAVNGDVDTPGLRALYFNRRVAQLAQENRDYGAAGEFGMSVQPFPPRFNGGEPVVDAHGSYERDCVSYFREPFIEINERGYIFQSYKGRWARHGTSLVSKLAIHALLYTKEARPALYQCAGTPA